jgi:hypothetical protein
LPRRSAATEGVNQPRIWFEKLRAKTNPEESMRLDQANTLLDHLYTPFESGWQRLPNGVIHVAARTHMIGCTGAMVNWWFGFIHNTEQYLWWHPRDHLFSDWDGERGTGRYIGGTHLVHEYIGPDIYKLKINFREPSEILNTNRFAEAKISAAVFGYVGDLEREGYFGRLLHLVQDTPEGCVMRSRFWLGELDPMPNPPPTPAALHEMVPDRLGAGLHAHASEEMSILAGFLPTLYRMQHGDTRRGNADGGGR